jgi:ubiquinone/menaquinone biosynthesis C-methylase UbiE
MDIFTGAAKGYTKHRGEYPDRVIKIITSHLDLNDTGRLLDIGCGDGRLTLPLAPYFKEVMAVDISPEMIAEAKAREESLGIKNIQWLVKSADELDESFGRFACISFAQSLHWLDIEKIMSLSYKILTDTGAVLIMSGKGIWNYTSTKWEEKIVELIKKYLGPERRTLNGKFPSSAKSYEEYLRAAGFKRIEKFAYSLPQVAKTVDEVLAEQFTMSYAARDLFGDKIAEFSNEVKNELLKIQPDNKFIREITGTITLAFKN